ncbi:putative Nucleolar MIF4G domain-containing protein 1 [Monoraphidium neglectum]|uniref:Putative Nucleolar MIF4G domain-containing protein 1 n=1 Tax=Monoraphidium neglectum TaxID=145388 RepID=A0A0D2KGE2_9CHLO|nr:putative Nucleolar MIF4G domain-containing protein 1 [Monoraphidium neglectum]KIY94918.1 putative Nucleolar MIF4G domain-containing protein 1 [Monoraphidium neglectum]|eukprot:XP_013893938.1 putative Nucleolar MIF4G domain-containing protein 1 [Monoraphidium neglectum]
MKDLVVAVHEAAAKSHARGAGLGLTKRAEMMLELVMDIKNNRSGVAAPGKAPKSASAAGAGGGGRKGGAAAVLAPGQIKWLKGSGVDDVKLVNLSWAKLVAPDKKGMWWLPAAMDAAAGLLPGLAPRDLDLLPLRGDDSGDDEEEGRGGGGGAGTGAGAGAAELLKLAAAQRMNTDVRKAAFLAIMGSEDCAEACEKLLRLPLKGEQDREVVRVLIDCALHEVPWNPYYGHLAARIAAASKNHRMTLQFTVWDHIKEVEAAPVARLDNLAALLAALLAKQALPLTSLKVADFESSPRWTSRELFFWRLALQQLLGSYPTDKDCVAAFARLAGLKQQGQLARGLALFLKTRVGPWLVGRADAAAAEEQGRFDVLLRRLHAAEQTLARSQGAVLAA